MASYHKWDVKNGFAYVLTFFSLISDGLSGVNWKRWTKILTHKCDFNLVNMYFKRGVLSDWNTTQLFTMHSHLCDNIPMWFPQSGFPRGPTKILTHKCYFNPGNILGNDVLLWCSPTETIHNFSQFIYACVMIYVIPTVRVPKGILIKLINPSGFKK